MFSSRREGHSRRTPGFHRKSLFQLVLALAAGRPVFTADYYAVDGVSGKVASFIDWNDPTHSFTQGTSANQAVIPAPDATVNNARVVTASASEAYTSTRAASAWRFASETATEFYATAKINQAFFNRILGTMNQTPANTGWLLCNKDSSTSAWAQYVGNSTGTYHAQALSADGSAGVGTWRQISSRFVPSTSVVMRTAATEVSGTMSGSPPAGNPSTTMNMFLVGGVVSRVSMAYLWGWFPALTSDQRDLIRQSIQTVTGVAA